MKSGHKHYVISDGSLRDAIRHHRQRRKSLATPMKPWARVTLDANYKVVTGPIQIHQENTRSGMALAAKKNRACIYPKRPRLPMQKAWSERMKPGNQSSAISRSFRINFMPTKSMRDKRYYDIFPLSYNIPRSTAQHFDKIFIDPRSEYNRKKQYAAYMNQIVADGLTRTQFNFRQRVEDTRQRLRDAQSFVFDASKEVEHIEAQCPHVLGPSTNGSGFAPCRICGRGFDVQTMRPWPSEG